MCEVSCNKLSETSVDDVIHAQDSSCWYSHSEKIVVENHMCSKPDQIVFVFALRWNAADAFETVLLFMWTKYK